MHCLLTARKTLLRDVHMGNESLRERKVQIEEPGLMELRTQALQDGLRLDIKLQHRGYAESLMTLASDKAPWLSASG